jgi:N-acetylmuramic acid 6-phosphate etherase
MTAPDFQDSRLTERRNPRTTGIDVASALEIVDAMYEEDRRVPEIVHGQREAMAAVIEMVVAAFRAGGRLMYAGAGTSGRLGVLDAAECPPTFGSPPEMVVGIIAGGPQALTRSQEGAEDDWADGAAQMDLHRVRERDVVVGIAASGTTPWVHAALERAKALGAHTVLVTCTDPPQRLTSHLDAQIVARVGPEVLTGSTRLKAGTATKLILNTISTGAMLRLGKAYGNLMVDLMAWSEKLEDRSQRIVMEVCGVSRAEAQRAIDASGRSVKLAIVMLRRGVDLAEARRLLDAGNGSVRAVLGNPPPVAT